MLYAILCYEDEKAVGAWTKAEDDACMARLDLVHQTMGAKGKLGPVARLHNTKAATTLRKNNGAPLVVDGPFAETKEQFLGFYVADCDSLDEAVGFAKDLAAANPGSGAYEIRPLSLFKPGALSNRDD
ncbi:YciI family protein [Devosia beringensis]|uniref:YciI family protein n=1 Tax=Devosia beringensis TaxID=2657486 RepID=UPI00186B62E9|nr:YciI family protein [Devosia beringensis]